MSPVGATTASITVDYGDRIDELTNWNNYCYDTVTLFP